MRAYAGPATRSLRAIRLPRAVNAWKATYSVTGRRTYASDAPPAGPPADAPSASEAQAASPPSAPAASNNSSPTDSPAAPTLDGPATATAENAASPPLASSSTPAPGPESIGGSSPPTTNGRRRRTVEHRPLPQYFPSGGLPDLRKPDVLLDAAESITFYPEPGSRLRAPATVTVRNDTSIFELERLRQAEQRKARGEPASDDRAAAEAEVREMLDEGISSGPLLEKFARTSGVAAHRYLLLFRRVVQQTPKGRRPSFASLVCVGNGAGLVGYGEGKDEDPGRSQVLAYHQALRNMDRVARFEQRTLFTELRTKLGATQVILRPRPVGFGLRTNPHIHQVMKAAGIKDASAKVWGSRNPLNVIKATFRMLWAGHAPQAMGDGIGGPGKKLEKGGGSRTKQDVERERGRRLLDLRT